MYFIIYILSIIVDDANLISHVRIAYLLITNAIIYYKNKTFKNVVHCTHK